MSGTTLPATLDALVALFTAALPALQVVDGPNYDPSTAFLAVGWHSNDEAAASPTSIIADLGRRADREDYDVSCLLSYHVGASQDGMSAARSSLYASFAAINAALDTDSNLGGAVYRARVSEHSYVPLIDETGVMVTIRFLVSVIAWK